MKQVNPKSWPELKNDFLNLSEQLKLSFNLNIFHHQDGKHEYPLYSLISNQQKYENIIYIIGGIHGKESIGVEIILNFLKEISNHKSLLNQNKIIIIPWINPIGIHRKTRSNHNSIDLMRNAQIKIDNRFGGSKLPLGSGHHLSPKIPWYAGKNNLLEIEPELKALENLIYSFWNDQTNNLNKSVTNRNIILDLHSGYGSVDSIWYPWAYQKQNFPFMDQIIKFKLMVQENYQWQSQSEAYLIAGDFWDYMTLKFLDFTRSQKSHSQKSHSQKPHCRELENSFFIPLTLEMGSWSWIKQNPLQIFRSLGLFYPYEKNENKNVMEKHLPLLNFLLNFNFQ